jgi:ubiquitin-protein ligase
MSSRNAQAAIRRLQRELQLLLKDPVDLVSASPAVEDNLFVWNGTIVGPEGTPYAGRKYSLLVQFTENYPFEAPKILFTTPVFHPNVGSEGTICLDLLKDKWSPALAMSKVLLSILSLLSDPNPASPLNAYAATLYTSDRAKYDEIVASGTVPSV